MCEIDFDEYASLWNERLVHARKQHICATCGTTIVAGEPYIYHFSLTGNDKTIEKQCLRCRTIRDAFTREHVAMVTPGSLWDFLDQCLDEERWADDDLDDNDDVDEDREVPRNRLPSRLSDAGLRWKYAREEIRARNRAAWAVLS